MKRKKNRLWTAIVLLFLTTLLVYGCGAGKKVDYTIEDTPGENKTGQEQTGGEELTDTDTGIQKGKIGLAQFQDADDWKEQWLLPLEAYMEVQVDAQILLPEVSGMSVVEVEETEFDAAFKQQITEKLLGEGPIYYGDVSHLPRKDLEQLRDFWENGKTVYSEYPTDADDGMQEWRKMWDAIDNLDTAPDTYTPAESYEENTYIGTYNGIPYELKFTGTAGDSVYIRRIRQIILEPKDLYQICPETMKDQENLTCEPWIYGDWKDNRCSISQEEAADKAEKAAQKLGLDYPVASKVRPLVWGQVPEVIPLNQEEDQDWTIHGYVFSYDMGIDDLSFVEYGMEEDYADFWSRTERTEEIQYSMETRLDIYVTESGVVRMVANNPVKITGVSQNVELLPLETIQDIMRQAVQEQANLFRFNFYNNATFNEMELLYFRVRDQKNPGKYSYVPTWRLGMVRRDDIAHTISIQNPVLINAIDGSVIYFYDET